MADELSDGERDAIEAGDAIIRAGITSFLVMRHFPTFSETYRQQIEQGASHRDALESLRSAHPDLVGNKRLVDTQLDRRLLEDLFLERYTEFRNDNRHKFTQEGSDDSLHDAVIAHLTDTYPDDLHDFYEMYSSGGDLLEIGFFAEMYTGLRQNGASQSDAFDFISRNHGFDANSLSPFQESIFNTKVEDVLGRDEFSNSPSDSRNPEPPVQSLDTGPESP